MPGQKKKCGICKRELSLDFFYKKKHGKYGVNANCKECLRIQERRIYRENNQKIRERKNARMRSIYIELTPQERRDQSSLKRLHYKVRKIKTNQKYCSICNEEKRLQLSSLNGDYTKNPSDYWWLCSECHHLYDRINKTHKVVI